MCSVCISLSFMHVFVCAHIKHVCLSVYVLCACVCQYTASVCATDYHSAIIDRGCARLCASAVLCVCTVFMCTCYVCTWLFLDVYVWKYTVGLLC